MAEKTDKKTFHHYLYFLLGQQFSMLGSMIVGFVITWWMAGNVIFLSLSVFLMFLPQIIVTPFSGVMSDRWNKKAIIAIADSMQAGLTFLLFIFFLLDIQNIVFILVINTFRAASFAFQMPAVQSLIPIMVPKKNLSRVNGVNFLSSAFIFTVGPMVAAGLMAFIPQTEMIFLLDIITFLIAMVPLLIIKIPTVQQITEEAAKKSMFKDFKTGLLTIKMIPGLFAMIAFAMIWNFINRPWAVLLPNYIYDTHGGTALNLAMIFTAGQLGNILGSIITSLKKTWKHKIKINIIGGALFFVCQLPAILAPTGNFIVIMIAMFPAQLIFPITVSTYLAILQVVVSKDKIGRIMSIDHMISMAIAPIGALIAGPLALLMGIRTLFLIMAILGIIHPFMIWFFTKIRKLEIIEQEIMAKAEEEEEEETLDEKAKEKVEEIAQPAEIVQVIEPVE
jgi:DHA3 family macrolide efflux protein-like MFS transporter